MMIINESNSNSNSNSHSHSNRTLIVTPIVIVRVTLIVIVIVIGVGIGIGIVKVKAIVIVIITPTSTSTQIYVHTYTHIYICIIDHLQSDKRILSSSRPAQQSSHGRLADPGGLGPWHLRKPASRPAARPMPIDGNRKLCDADLNHRPSVAKRGQAGHLGF
jgi:hypothetical protein